MKRTHLGLGACVAALAGAITGAAINTHPLPRGVDAWDHIPEHQFTAEALEADARSEPLPDHYPLITPSGRVEVAELRDRGLYRNRRFGMSAGWYGPAEEPSYEVVAADYRYVPDNYSGDYRPPARESRDPSAVAEQAKPVKLAVNAEPLVDEATIALPVRPRTIDVAATLASRP